MSLITAMDFSMDGALDQITNESSSPPPSPPSATAKTGPALRHKSMHLSNPDLDSSESYPSPHSSIYEASLVRHSEEKVNFIPYRTINDDLPPWSNIVPDASGCPVPTSFLQALTSKDIHVPHELYPITEKSSLATIRASLSLKDQGSVPTLRTRSPGLNGKRSKSFSLSDLPPMPERHSPPPTPRLLTPVIPPKPPPERIPTPPGLPTFGQPEAVNYQLSPPKRRFRDNFRTKTPELREYHRQTVGLPKGIVMRGDNGVIVRGKFTPIVSGHFPPQRQFQAVYRSPHQSYAASTDQRTSVGEANALGNRVVQTRALHRDDRPQARNAQSSTNDWKQVCLFVSCCGLCSYPCKEGPASKPTPTVVSRGGDRWELQPPSARARYRHGSDPISN